MVACVGDIMSLMSAKSDYRPVTPLSMSSYRYMLIFCECLDSTPAFGAFFYGVNQSMQSNAVGEVRCMGCPLGDILRKRRVEIGQFENAPFELRAGKPL